eukprot:6474890-Amphidinium_carterae.2
MPEDSVRFNSQEWVCGPILGGMLVYVDDLLKWATSPPEIFRRRDADIDTLRFLGVELELTEQIGQVVMHQHPYLVYMVERCCPDLRMRSRGNPGEPDSFQEAQKRAMETAPEQKPSEGNLLATVGSLLWADQIVP